MSSAHRLSLAVQYAFDADKLPSRAQFRRWIRAALECDVQVTLRIVDETEGRALNRDYRGKDSTTNVLTFVYDDTNQLSGDIVMCAPQVAREARAQHKDLAAHYAHLAIHAALHLQGHDHENATDAMLMEARETAIMAKLGYADPYRKTTNK